MSDDQLFFSHMAANNAEQKVLPEERSHLCVLVVLRCS
jgi:hypothetical protein